MKRSVAEQLTTVSHLQGEAARGVLREAIDQLGEQSRAIRMRLVAFRLKA